MRILIVKLSSLGDIVHTLPVVADIRAAHPGASVDWVVEPAFAPLVARVAGVAEVIECALRRWTREGWWRAKTRAEFATFLARLRRHRYDAVIDLQGLTKSALIARLARGPSYGLANRTEGASHEWPARWLATHAIRVESHSHALDRARELVAAALATRSDAPPSFGLAAPPRPGASSRTVVLIHGSSRADKLWPEASWVEIGKRLVDAGWRVALPQSGDEERARAARIAALVGEASEVGPSHIAVALGLPHVQIYNFATSWRTGPQVRHGARHQVAIEGEPTPGITAVWSAWLAVQPARGGAESAR